MVRALILGVFLTSLYYFFVYDSGDAQSKSIAGAKADTNLQKKTLSDLTAKVDHAHEYQRSASEMGEALNKLLAYIPENFRTQDFMKTVSEEAKIAGLNIIHVGESTAFEAKSDKHPEFEALGVSVEFEGTFAQEMTFLANLTKQKQIFIVERFSLDRAGNATVHDASGEQESPMLSFKAEIRAYRYVGGKKKS
jgi:type IV pilus assembly protein PilO